MMALCCFKAGEKGRRGDELDEKWVGPRTREVGVCGLVDDLRRDKKNLLRIVHPLMVYGYRITSTSLRA